MRNQDKQTKPFSPLSNFLTYQKNNTKSHYLDRDFRASSLKNASLNAPSQEFDVSIGSEVHDFGHELFSLH